MFLCPLYHGRGWEWGKLLASSGQTEAREHAEQVQCTDSHTKACSAQMSPAGALDNSLLKSDICHTHYFKSIRGIWPYTRILQDHNFLIVVNS